MRSTRFNAGRQALLAVFLGLACHAEEKAKSDPVPPPEEKELRAAIERGLDFLAREGDEWMEAKNCNSCHHLPLLLWSHEEARKRGFAVGKEKFDEWLEWAVERSDEKKQAAEEAALMILASLGESETALASRLAEKQKADGSWAPGTQFATMQRRGAADAQAGATWLSLAALAKAKPDEPKATGTRAEAKDDAPGSMETLVYRSVHALHSGPPDEAEKIKNEIIKRQRGDGGWSSVFAANMSDVLATGQALFALQPFADEPATAQAIARAQRWLITTQREDGGWPIDITHISQIDRSAPAKAKSFKEATGIYTFWGSAWATLGLLHTLPAAPEPSP